MKILLLWLIKTGNFQKKTTFWEKARGELRMDLFCRFGQILEVILSISEDVRTSSHGHADITWPTRLLFVGSIWALGVSYKI